MAGLRLMVNHGTNIAALCRIGQQYSLRPEADCDDMSVGVKQVRYLSDIQDYVDAQHGGAGKGWFRIVKSPAEARQVINDGKMAVVPGVEFAQIFNCGVTFTPGGGEMRKCNEAQIDAEIQRLWDLGVRHIYPYHDIDSSLGGTGIFSANVINYLNFLDTGSFWKTRECRAFPANEPHIREPGAAQTTAVPGTGNDPISTAIFAAISGTVPVYPPGVRCNARDFTDLGLYAMRKIMARRMVMDVDHSTHRTKDKMIELARELTPPYPLVSTHDAHGGLTSDQAAEILNDGGLLFPYKGHGGDHTNFLEKVKFWRNKNTTAGTTRAKDFILAVGYGADGNGFGGHPGPRGGNATPVKYPFTLFRGPDWGARYQRLPAMQVNLLTVPQSGKFWHIDEVGMAHYGMVADFVEEVRLEGGAEALDALYNSAEAYVQTWERAYNR